MPVLCKEIAMLYARYILPASFKERVLMYTRSVSLAMAYDSRVTGAVVR